MEMHPAFDSQVVEILIRLGYFKEFGSSGKLLRLFKEFREGEFKFSKSHIASTQEKRLSILRRIESEMAEEDLPLSDQLAFEVAMCGAPFTTDSSLRNEYVVVEIDNRYSPKIRLYSISTGRIGLMKLKKSLFNSQPIEVGTVLRLISWERRPSYRYADGKSRPDYEHMDLWITAYEKAY